MQHPHKLMFDHLQSDNYEPESSPGAGDGKGGRRREARPAWRQANHLG